MLDGAFGHDTFLNALGCADVKVGLKVAKDDSIPQSGAFQLEETHAKGENAGKMDFCVNLKCRQESFRRWLAVRFELKWVVSVFSHLKTGERHHELMALGRKREAKSEVGFGVVGANGLKNHSPLLCLAFNTSSQRPFSLRGGWSCSAKASSVL